MLSIRTLQNRFRFGAGVRGLTLNLAGKGRQRSGTRVVAIDPGGSTAPQAAQDGVAPEATAQRLAHDLRLLDKLHERLRLDFRFDHDGLARLDDDADDLGVLARWLGVDVSP